MGKGNTYQRDLQNACNTFTNQWSCPEVSAYVASPAASPKKKFKVGYEKHRWRQFMSIHEITTPWLAPARDQGRLAGSRRLLFSYFRRRCGRRPPRHVTLLGQCACAARAVSDNPEMVAVATAAAPGLAD
ncbi:hypothetical protein NDU88_000639 [Pleurodeles waltl]|uniref:Uncharacterized protein n=1 Tax=Pleurodeles waltl TaxID=8319 RepID=A0AAV7LDN7_PLEWA|nr:hypothetical protein NDU88_000639 [Pleurodeles waltl]